MNLAAKSNVIELFAAVTANNTIAFQLLFEQYRAKMYAVALKLTKSSYAAEEITQEIFISLWTGRAKLQNVRDPEAYLYTMAYHKISRYLKKESSRTRILELDIWWNNRFSNETEETVFANESILHINKAVEGLSPQKKLIYQLNRQQGKSCVEIAKALNVSPNTVKSQLLKAVRTIRHYLEKKVLFIIYLLILSRY
jgi:RNA polymerase sigma-70 factor (ECF subfamily)